MRWICYCSVTCVDQILSVWTLYRARSIVGLLDLEANIHKASIGQRHTYVTSNSSRGTVTFAVLTLLNSQRAAFRGVVKHKVQYTSDGVRTILSRCTVTQYFNLLQCDTWDNRNICALRTVIHAAALEGDN